MATTFTKSGYQLVLTRVSEKNGVFQFKPEKIFSLYLAPRAVLYAPRKPHNVTPLMFGAHIDTGIQILADLTISLSTGQQAMLSSDPDGNPVVYTGKERAEALRIFLENASKAIHDRTHRLEFHSDPRNYHFVVVPQVEEHRIESGGISRLGGSDFNLRFVVVGEVRDGVSLFGTVDSFFKDAMRYLKRATGAAALTLSLLKDSLNLLPRVSQATVGSLIDQGRVLLNEVSGVVDAGENLASLPFEISKEYSDFIAEVRAEFAENEVVGDDINRLDEEIDAVMFAQKMATDQSQTAPGGEVTDGITLGQSATEGETATLVSDLEGQGDSLADLVDNAGVNLESLKSDMATYTGWLPLIVQAGQSLMDMAEKVLGDPNLWMDIAAINGLYDPYQPPGLILKIPTSGGGYPFSWGDPSELEEFLKELEIRLYYRDVKLEDKGKGGVDWKLNSKLNDVDTISGRENYAQRYRFVVFKTELGLNPEFPGVGVFLGIGQKRLAETIGLTHISARQQLLLDPRTSSVTTKRAEDTPDGALVEFDVGTVPITVDTFVESLLVEV
jgi:nucleoid-associated protein YgaU